MLAIAKLRFHFEEVEFYCNDSLENDRFADLKVDAVIMHPPWNLPRQSNLHLSNDPRFSDGLPSKSNSNLLLLHLKKLILNIYRINY